MRQTAAMDWQGQMITVDGLPGFVVHLTVQCECESLVVALLY